MTDALTTTSATPGTTGFVVFRLGGRRYASALGAVREIVRLQRLDGLPAMRPPLAGVLDLRGSALPVLDIRPADGGRGGRGDVLVLEPDGAGESVGVAVDEVCAVVDRDGLAPMTGGATSGLLPGYVLDVARDADGQVFVVDLRRMFATPAADQT